MIRNKTCLNVKSPCMVAKLYWTAAFHNQDRTGCSALRMIMQVPTDLINPIPSLCGSAHVFQKWNELCGGIVSGDRSIELRSAGNAAAMVVTKTKWKDFKDPVANPSNPRVVFFYLPALEKAKQRSIRCSVLIAFGPNIPHNLFCEWLGDWLGGHDIIATMHKRVCEGFFVVVCDKEGACDIAAPALRDYPHMRPAIFPVTVDLFTKADDMVVKVVALPNLPFQSQCYLPAIANKLGLFVGHTGAENSPKAPRIQENTFLGHFLYNQQQQQQQQQAATPAPVKILILAQCEKRIPPYLQLQVSQDEWYRQTLVQERLNFPYSPIFPPERRQPRFFTSLENKRSRLCTVLNTRGKRVSAR